MYSILHLLTIYNKYINVIDVLKSVSGQYSICDTIYCLVLLCLLFNKHLFLKVQSIIVDMLNAASRLKPT